MGKTEPGAGAFYEFFFYDEGSFVVQSAVRPSQGEMLGYEAMFE